MYRWGWERAGGDRKKVKPKEREKLDEKNCSLNLDTVFFLPLPLFLWKPYHSDKRWREYRLKARGGLKNV